MPRPYHSPSSIALGQRCQRAWAYRYIDGLRRPELSWEEIEAGATPLPGQRSTALGKATHAVGEAYFGEPEERAAIDWSKLPAQIYHSGLPYLPPPAECALIEPERPIGSTPIEQREFGAPDRALELHGIRWAGFRDLLIACPRVRFVAHPDLPSYFSTGVLLVDYKTTSSIRKWAKTPEQLLADPQHALYTVDVGRAHGLSVVPSRWLYLENGSSRRAYPCDVEMSVERAVNLLGPLADLARELDTIERSCDTAMSLGACQDYGGCEYHSRAGGPCPAKSKPWADIPVKIQRKENIMPISSSLASRFSVAKKALATVEAPAEATPIEAPEAPPAEAPPVEAPAEAPPVEAPSDTTPLSLRLACAHLGIAEHPPAEARVRKPGRGARAPSPPPAQPVIDPPPVTVPADSQIASVLELQSRIADAEARRAAVVTELAGLLGELRGVLS